MKHIAIEYFLSKKGQDIVGKNNCRRLMDIIHISSGFQKLVNSVKSIIIFKSTEFFNGSSLRISTKKMTRNTKKY